MDSIRYFLRFAYNGASYHGWQFQKNAHTVQGELQEALFYVLNKRKVELTGAGRTDTGVHAREYFAHFDFDTQLTNEELKQIVYHLNHILPPSIGVYDAFKVNPDAHARFSAISRTYQYHICRDYNPFTEGISYRLTIPLNIELMEQAAAQIINYNDFTCFTKSGTQTSTNICKVYESKWIIENNILIYKTRANRFLRNMVRAMVGTLLDVGKERISLAQFINILEKGTRSDAGQSVPACGLFLEDIEYPNNIRSW